MSAPITKNLHPPQPEKGDVEVVSREPSVEFRVPISANEQFMRMLRYLMESVRQFGGCLAQSARFAVVVSRDEPERDLHDEFPWLAEYPADIYWMDQILFDRFEYDGTGMARFDLPTTPDIVILCDADILVVGDLDDVIRYSYQKGVHAGFIAHASPFNERHLAHIPSETWWRRIFFEAGLPCPEFNQFHTAPGLMGYSASPAHRNCPYYFNYGFIVSPRAHVECLAQCYESDLLAVDRAVETWFKSQIANTLAYTRHNIPCSTLSILYNFPLHLPEITPTLREAEERYQVEDIRVFHYLGNGEFNKKDFSSQTRLTDALHRVPSGPAAAHFQRCLGQLSKQLEGLSASAPKRRLHLLNSLRFRAESWLFRSIRWAQGRYRGFRSKSQPDHQVMVIMRLIDISTWFNQQSDDGQRMYFKNQGESKLFFTSLIRSVSQSFEKLEAQNSRAQRKRDAIDRRLQALFPELEDGEDYLVQSYRKEDAPAVQMCFICGCRRSGTTLMAAMLASVEASNALSHEAHLVTRLMDLYVWAQDRQLGAEILEILNTYLVRMVNGMLSHRQRAITLKSPELAYSIGVIHDVFPQALVLAMVRDPRDQIASEREVINRRQRLKEADGTWVTDHVSVLAHKYNDYVDPILQYRKAPKGRFLLVRYEDVVHRFDEVKERVSSLLGLPLTFDPVQRWENVALGAQLHEGPSQSPLYGQPISQNSVGRYGGDLGDHEVDEIESTCSVAMRRLGYAVNQKDARKP